MLKQIVVHLCHGILLSNENEWIIDTHNNSNGSQGNYADWKRRSQKVSFLLGVHLREKYKSFFFNILLENGTLVCLTL